DEAVGGFRLLDGHRPVAGENNLQRRLRVGEPRAHGEGIDVAQYLRDRFGSDKTELTGFRHVAGDDAADMLGFVDVAEIAAGVLRVLFAPQAAAVLETKLWILVGELDHMG